MSLNDDLMFHLRAMTRFLYVVTEEEDRLMVKLSHILKDFKERTFVYNSTFGMLRLDAMIGDWATMAHQTADQLGPNDALIKIYKDDPREEQNVYIITDPERHLTDGQIQRRLLNIIHHLHNNDQVVKILIFVSNRLYIPPKLQRYFEVIHDKGMTDEEYQDEITSITNKLEMEAPPDAVKHFRGLTSYEVTKAIAQCVIKTRREPTGKRLDPKIIADFKRRQLNKTDLLQYVDVSGCTFDQVGGAQRFKEWARKTKASWTEEGQKFGLVPPKGVLLVGVWGCGKSISAKGLANAWRLPLIQLETGKLRSSGVGESESNVYRVISLIESVAPCVLWIDEAEKNLAGTASSAQSDSGTTSRMIGILSTWLQETSAKVCLAMTANGIANLPPEFVSRMDERFFYDLPCEEERIEILKIHVKAKKQDPSKLQLAELAEVSKNMVGREIEHAISAAMTESFDAGKDGLDQDILAQELKSKPRIFKTIGKDLEDLLRWVGWDDEVQDGIRARFASAHRSAAVANRFEKKA